MARVTRISPFFAPIFFFSSLHPGKHETSTTGFFPQSVSSFSFYLERSRGDPPPLFRPRGLQQWNHEKRERKEKKWLFMMCVVSSLPSYKNRGSGSSPIFNLDEAVLVNRRRLLLPPHPFIRLSHHRHHSRRNPSKKTLKKIQMIQKPLDFHSSKVFFSGEIH